MRAVGREKEAGRNQNAGPQENGGYRRQGAVAAERAEGRVKTYRSAQVSLYMFKF